MICHRLMICFRVSGSDVIIQEAQLKFKIDLPFCEVRF